MATILAALCGVVLCILYSLFWLVVLLLCIPVLLVIAIPMLLIALPAGIVMMDKGLTVIDEDLWADGLWNKNRSHHHNHIGSVVYCSRCSILDQRTQTWSGISWYALVLQSGGEYGNDRLEETVIAIWLGSNLASPIVLLLILVFSSREVGGNVDVHVNWILVFGVWVRINVHA